jgi:hypothetical protein
MSEPNPFPFESFYSLASDHKAVQDPDPADEVVGTLKIDGSNGLLLFNGATGLHSIYSRNRQLDPMQHHKLSKKVKFGPLDIQIWFLFVQMLIDEMRIPIGPDLIFCVYGEYLNSSFSPFTIIQYRNDTILHKLHISEPIFYPLIMKAGLKMPDPSCVHTLMSITGQSDAVPRITAYFTQQDIQDQVNMIHLLLNAWPQCGLVLIPPMVRGSALPTVRLLCQVLNNDWIHVDMEGYVVSSNDRHHKLKRLYTIQPKSVNRDSLFAQSVLSVVDKNNMYNVDAKLNEHERLMVVLTPKYLIPIIEKCTGNEGTELNTVKDFTRWVNTSTCALENIKQELQQEEYQFSRELLDNVVTLRLLTRILSKASRSLDKPDTR